MALRWFFTILFLASTAAPPCLADADRSLTARCNFKYCLEIKNTKKWDLNVGIGLIQCGLGSSRSDNEVFIRTYNDRDYAEIYLEEGSLSGLSPNLMPTSFATAIVNTIPGATSYRAPTFKSNHVFSGILQNESFLQNELSFVVHNGNEYGFAIRQGFRHWILSIAGIGVIANANNNMAQIDQGHFELDSLVSQECSDRIKNPPNAIGSSVADNRR